MALQEDTSRLAIVTGAAGGMGSAVAHRFAALGWDLILCDLHQPGLEHLVSSLPQGQGTRETLAGNIGEAGFVDGLIDRLAGRPVGALVHSAGISPTMGSAPEMFAINYDATVRLVEAAKPRMARGACAVLIASTSGYLMKSPEIDAALDALRPGQDMTELLSIATDSGRAYSLSKRAVIRFVAREAAAFGKLGARIASISPGLIDTSMGRAERRTAEQMEAMLARTPIGRYGVADEIASVAVFLCSPEAAYISGRDIPVDGGMLATMRAL